MGLFDLEGRFPRFREASKQKLVTFYFRCNGEQIIDFNENLRGEDYYNGMLLFDNDSWSILENSGGDALYDIKGKKHTLFIANPEQVSEVTGINANQIKNARVIVSGINKGRHDGESYTSCTVSLVDKLSNKHLASIGAYIGQDGSVYGNPFSDSMSYPNLLSNSIAYYGDEKWHDSAFSDVKRSNFVGKYVDPKFNTLFNLKTMKYCGMPWELMALNLAGTIVVFLAKV